MSPTIQTAVAVIGIDIGKNSFHVIGHDDRGAIVLRQKWSRGQVERRLANMSPCLIGMEACVGAHHLSRRLQAMGRISLRLTGVRGTSCPICCGASCARPRRARTLFKEAQVQLRFLAVTFQELESIMMPFGP